jgi:hypothetical protein
VVAVVVASAVAAVAVATVVVAAVATVVAVATTAVVAMVVVVATAVVVVAVAGKQPAAAAQQAVRERLALCVPAAAGQSGSLAAVRSQGCQLSLLLSSTCDAGSASPDCCWRRAVVQPMGF